MQMQKPSTDTYVLGQTPEAIQRLFKQGQLLNPFTHWVLEEVGITGMHGFDLDCGPGDVSLLVAVLMRPDGHGAVPAARVRRVYEAEGGEQPEDHRPRVTGGTRHARR